MNQSVSALGDAVRATRKVLFWSKFFYLAMIEFNDLHIDVLANLVKLFSLQLIITILVI